MVKGGYDLYKAYCDVNSYKAMKEGPEYSKDSYYIKSEYDENGNIKSGTNDTACYCDLGQLKEHNTVQIRIYVKTKSNKAGDTYVNTFDEAADSTSVKTDRAVAPYASENETEESQVEVTSNQVITTVVERAIRGRAKAEVNNRKDWLLHRMMSSCGPEREVLLWSL